MDGVKEKLISVTIIEDSDIHRTLFFEKLSEDNRFKVLSQDFLGRAGIESVKKYRPDIVLLDFQLPDITGIEVSKRIKSYDASIKILAVTAHTEKSIVEKIIQDKNVDGVAIKGSHYFQGAFFEMVAMVANGGSYVDPSLLNVVRDTKDASGLSQLTRREFEIFMQVSAGKSDDAIAADLCVDVLHVKNIRSKVSKKTNHSLIRNITQQVAENV